MKTIIFTGGGSSGHVTPNLALIHYFQNNSWHVAYIGSIKGIEKEIISRLSIPYYAISTGKFRRYFSWKTALAPFQIFIGILQAIKRCRQLKPTVIFSKGGFVAFPVVLAAWILRIPVIAHESDLTPGLANRLTYPFVKKICITFPESIRYFKNKQKIILTGTPIREELLKGDPARGRALCQFNENKPILMVFGGGLGSVIINQAIRNLLPRLVDHFQIAHLCGKGKVDPFFENTTGYRQFDYLNEELPDVLACSDFIVSRAGANSIYELLTLKKPHLLIPLSKKASRGDQVENAKYWSERGLSQVLEEEQLSNEALFDAIINLYQHREKYRQELAKLVLPDSVKMICEEIVSSSLFHLPPCG